MQAVQAAAAAIGPSGLPSSSTTSTNDDKENKPSIEILQQVFSTFGEIRCCDIPFLDPLRISNNNASQDTTFDAYIQYSEYIGFVKAMDACRNMKLMLIDDTNTAYTASIKVRFIINKKYRLRKIFRWILIEHDIYQIE
jgi:arginine/serine-rich splicing factor 17